MVWNKISKNIQSPLRSFIEFGLIALVIGGLAQILVNVLYYTVRTWSKFFDEVHIHYFTAHPAYYQWVLGWRFDPALIASSAILTITAYFIYSKYKSEVSESLRRKFVITGIISNLLAQCLYFPAASLVSFIFNDPILVVNLGLGIKGILTWATVGFIVYGVYIVSSSLLVKYRHGATITVFLGLIIFLIAHFIFSLSPCCPQAGRSPSSHALHPACFVCEK